MSNHWKRLKLWWKRYRCKHAHYIEDIERVSSMQVRCPCHKCGGGPPCSLRCTTPRTDKKEADMSNGRDLAILFRRYYNDPKVGLATACEKCGAQPGAPCLTSGGNTAQTHHLYRHRRAWSAAHQAMSGKKT